MESKQAPQTGPQAPPPAFESPGALATLRRATTTLAVGGRHAGSWAHRATRADRARLAAKELRGAFEELGPTYVKLAQLIASSPGLFPEVLAAEFRACLDRVPPIPTCEVHRIIAAEFGTPAGDLFAAFDDQPLASASIAQVHAATLRDGTDVVVKVQRPGLAGLLGADMAILRRLAGLVDRVSSTGAMANPTAVVEDFTTTLGQELNFVIEARSMERFAANLTSSGRNEQVRVPTVHWPLTTPRVLTMERVHGYKIDDLAALDATGWDLPGALKAGVRAWMDAVLVHRDFQQVAAAIYQLGAILSPADLEQSARDISELVTPILDQPLSQISYGEILIDIIRIGTRYQVRLPRELVLVAKQLLYFERYAKLLAPNWTILDDPELINFLFETATPAAENG